MIGGHGSGENAPPRVVHVSIARYEQALPEPGRALDYLVTFHEEGAGISWQRNATVPPDAERRILDATQSLYEWSRGWRSAGASAPDLLDEVGTILYETFIGEEGTRFLERDRPVSAYLFDVDETTLNIPWELTRGPEGPLAFATPFGRLVTTRVLPRLARDPGAEDAVLRILAVANPTQDLPSTEGEIETIASLEGDRGDYRVKVETLRGTEATPDRFRALLKEQDFDILHFAGHAGLDRGAPERSSIRLAGGEISAAEVLSLEWRRAPPYIVFNSACESGRAVGGRRLVGEGDSTNGLAAAFLAAGVMAYAGYFWPVSDVGAALFGSTFYRALFHLENVGLAFREARREAYYELRDRGDLTAHSAVLFGDAATGERPDIYTAA